MNTRPIPALTMLIAGIITCVVGYMQNYDLYELLKLLVFVLVCFYIIGSIAKMILDCFINNGKRNLMTSKENSMNENPKESDLGGKDGRSIKKKTLE